MFSKPLLILAAAGLASAHFKFNWPPLSSDFSDDGEDTKPCGLANTDISDDSTKVSVDQFALSLYSGHPMGQWTFSATTDTKAPYNFTEISQDVTTSGGGDFCLTNFKVPSEWAGKGGLIQARDNTIDGSLYLCVPVNFVEGSDVKAGGNCKNNTGFKASYSSSSASESGSASSSQTASPSTSSNGAAMATGMGTLVGGLGLLAAGLAL